MQSRGRDLVGTAVIARALGVSRRTVERMIARGELKAVKVRANTSPWRATREEVERLKRGNR